MRAARDRRCARPVRRHDHDRDLPAAAAGPARRVAQPLRGDGAAGQQHLRARRARHHGVLLGRGRRPGARSRAPEAAPGAGGRLRRPRGGRSGHRRPGGGAAPPGRQRGDELRHAAAHAGGALRAVARVPLAGGGAGPAEGPGRRRLRARPGAAARGAARRLRAYGQPVLVLQRRARAGGHRCAARLHPRRPAPVHQSRLHPRGPPVLPGGPRLGVRRHRRGGHPGHAGPVREGGFHGDLPRPQGGPGRARPSRG